MMAERLAESDVKLDRNRYDNTCKIFSKDSDMNLKDLAPLLGFPKDKVIQASTWTNSPSNVDVNLGLRCRPCSPVDTDRNFDHYEKRSKVIATLPVTTEQSLISSVTHYRDLTSEVAVVNADHNLFEFKVGTNLGKEVDLKVMFRVVSRINNMKDRAQRGDRVQRGDSEILTLPSRNEGTSTTTLPRATSLRKGYTKKRQGSEAWR